jgi:hypothetical protein
MSAALFDADAPLLQLHADFVFNTMGTFKDVTTPRAAPPKGSTTPHSAASDFVAGDHSATSLTHMSVVAVAPPPVAPTLAVPVAVPAAGLQYGASLLLESNSVIRRTTTSVTYAAPSGSSAPQQLITAPRPMATQYAAPMVAAYPPLQVQPVPSLQYYRPQPQPHQLFAQQFSPLPPQAMFPQITYAGSSPFQHQPMVWR